MNETDFLTNIARRLGRQVPLNEPPKRTVIGAPEFWKNYTLSSEDKVAQFQTALENLGGHVMVCENLDGLRQKLGDVLQQLAPRNIGTWGGNTLTQFEIDGTLETYHSVAWGKDRLTEFEQIEVGITGCAYAVADTGRLVMQSDVARGRSVSVLPAVHIALVHERQIYTRLGEVMDELAQVRKDMPSSVHFISGPSRSSDIENDQTIGIHGPAAVYVLVLKESKNP